MLPRTALLIAAALTSAFVARAEITLVAGGEARAIIVVPTEPTPVAQYAAEELAYHVERATGVALPIAVEDAVPAQPATRVYVGPCAATAAQIELTTLDEEAAVIRSAGDALFIVGDDGDGDALDENTRAGTLWGVYELLERELGVVWLWPGELGTYVPTTDSVVVRDQDARCKPHLLVRRTRPGIIARESFTQGFTEEGLAEYRHAQQVFLRRHRQGATYPLHWGHAFSAWWAQYGAEHPEWFQLLDNGQRGPLTEAGAWNVSMCVSEPSFHQEIIRQWQERRAAEPERWQNLNICENDCPGRCVCPNCRAWDEPLQPGDEGKPVEGRSLSNRYARFWSAVYDLAAAIDPDVIVTAYIYANYRQPPTADIRLNENVLLGFVPAVNFPLDEALWERVRTEWLAWRATGARLFLRPNSTLVGHAMPYNYAHQLGDLMRFVMANGCAATDFDSLPGQWATMGPTLYVLCRAHTRPDLDTDAMLAEYYAGFGPAAADVQAYFDFWEQRLNDVILGDASKRGLLFWLSFGTGEHLIYGPEQFAEAGRILERAEAAAPDGVFAQRVGFIRLGYEHARLCAEISRLLAGADPSVSPLAVYDRLEELRQFRLAHEGEMFANLAFASFIEQGSWKVPERPNRAPVRAVAEEVAPLEGEPAFSLRGAHNAVALLQAGDHFRATLTARRLGSNPAPIGWHLIAPDDTLLASGLLQPDETAEIDVPVPADGLYLLMTQTSRNQASLTLRNEHAALAGARVDLLGPSSPMFFFVPAGIEGFSLTIDSQVPENVRVTVLAPDGATAAEAETGDLREITLRVEVPAGQDGKPWQVVTGRPSVGILEDHALTLGPELPPYWSLAPDRLVVQE